MGDDDHIVYIGHQDKKYFPISPKKITFDDTEAERQQKENGIGVKLCLPLKKCLVTN